MNPESLLDHADFVRELSRSLVRGDAESDDLAQETWLAALRHPPERGPGLRGWLARVMRNTAVSDWRRRSRRATREQASRRSRRAPSPAEILEREETRQELVSALKALPEAQRDAIALRCLEGLPPREIARRLDVPVETVKTRIQRGMKALRAELDRRHGGDRRAWVALLLPLFDAEGAERGPMAGASRATGRGFPAVRVLAVVTGATLLAVLGVILLGSPEAANEPGEPPRSSEGIASENRPEAAGAGESDPDGEDEAASGEADAESAEARDRAALAGRWRMLSRVESDGTTVDIPAEQRTVYEFDVTAGTMVVDDTARYPLLRLGNGDLRVNIPGAGLAIVYRPAIDGDRLALTLVSTEGEQPTGPPPPAPEGETPPPPEPDLPPNSLTFERVPEAPPEESAVAAVRSTYEAIRRREFGGMSMAMPLTLELGRKLRALVPVSYRQPLPLLESHLAYLDVEEDQFLRQLARTALASSREAVDYMIERRSWRELTLRGQREAAGILAMQGPSAVPKLAAVLSDPADPVVLMALMCLTRHTWGATPRYLGKNGPPVPDAVARHWRGWIETTWPALSKNPDAAILSHEIAEVRSLFESADPTAREEGAQRLSALTTRRYSDGAGDPPLRREVLEKLLERCGSPDRLLNPVRMPFIYESW